MPEASGHDTSCFSRIGDWPDRVFSTISNVCGTAVSSTTMYRSISDHSSTRLNAAAPASQNAWTYGSGRSSEARARIIESRVNGVFWAISESPKSATLLYITPCRHRNQATGGFFVPSAPAESDRQQLMQAAHGVRISQALYVVAKLGIADLLEDGPKTGNELAKRGTPIRGPSSACSASSRPSDTSPKTRRIDSG